MAGVVLNRMPMWRLLSFACLMQASIFSFAQVGDQTLTKIAGWNAYVHLPADYATQPTKVYPIIIFVPGLGEIGTDPAKVLAMGPGYFIKQGHKMEFMVNGVLETPIVISLQPATAWPSALVMNKYLDSIVQRWRVDVNRISCTGLSMGGWTWDHYVTATVPYANRPAAIVSMSAPPPNYPMEFFANFAITGGKWWGFEGTQDYRKMDLRRDYMNNAVPGSARYTKYVGGHSGWNTWYNPSWNESGESIYTWMLKQRKSGTFVVPANSAPVANAGVDITITLPVNTAKLVGIATDKDGAVYSSKWIKIGGPTTYTATNMYTPNVTLTNLVAGKYVFEFSTVDFQSVTARDTLNVVVNAAGAANVVPIANAGADQSIQTGTTININSSACSDPDGTIVSKTWTITNNATGTVVLNAAATLPATLPVGSYTVVLKVTDNSGATATDSMILTVTPVVIANQQPKAVAGADQIIHLPATSALLNASASTDVDGTIASVHWLQLSGPATCQLANVNAIQTTASMLIAGTYKFQLTVTDDDAALAKDTLQIIVNTLPVVNAGVDRVIAVGNNISISASATDADGIIATQTWTISNCTTKDTFQTCATSFPTTLPAGTYAAVLSATDNNGGVASDEMILVMNATPTAQAGNDISIIAPANSLSISSNGSYDTDGTIVSFHWMSIAGPAGIVIQNQTSATPTFSGLTTGQYYIKLTVADNFGFTDADTLKVEVLAPVVVLQTRNRILIDAGPLPYVGQTTTQDKWGKYWNNITDGRAGIRLTNAKDTANKATTLGIEILSRMDGTFSVNGNGMNGGNTIGDIGDYPATATNDNVFAHNTTTSGAWRIFGLDPSLTYSFKFWGTRTTYGIRTIQIKKSTDAAYTQESNSVMNTDYNNAMYFENITGVTEIVFNMRVKPGQTFGNISVIDIVTTSNMQATAPAANMLQTNMAEVSMSTAITTQKMAEAIPENMKVAVWPNPASGNCTVQMSNSYNGQVIFSILNVNGAVAKIMTASKTQNMLTQSINLWGMAKGMYYIKVQLGSRTEVQKLMVQ